MKINIGRAYTAAATRQANKCKRTILVKQTHFNAECRQIFGHWCFTRHSTGELTALQISLLGQRAGNGREEDWKLSRRRMDGRKVRTVKDKEGGAGKNEGRKEGGCSAPSRPQFHQLNI